MWWGQLIGLLLAPPVFANPIDIEVNQALKWERKELAAQISDYTLGAHVVATLAYTGREPEKRWERVGAVTGAYLSNYAMNYAVKRMAKRWRPSLEDRESFYSGHTSTAFVGAGAVCLQNSKAPCYVALGFAATVGYLRMAAEKHWLSDVTFGGGVGFAYGRYFPTVIVRF
jgi:membrane-associated phospholipid phosphatase